MENPAQPQLASEQPSSKPERNWKKILLFLLIGLFLISLVGVGLYLLVPKLTRQPASPTQKQTTPSSKKDETPSWKTYTNKTIGFQLDYPSDFNLQELVKLTKESQPWNFSVDGNTIKDLGQAVSITHKNLDYTFNEEQPQQLGLAGVPLLLLNYDINIYIGNILDVSSQEDLAKVAKNYVTQIGTSTDSDKIATIQINGKTGYKITRLPVYTEYLIFLPSNKVNQAIFIQVDIPPVTNPNQVKTPGDPYSSPGPKYEKNKILFNQILSTFKFLN